jgi:hypothetical protein
MIPRVAIAGRYEERASILKILIETHLNQFVEIQASWLTHSSKDDAALSDKEAADWALFNCYEIVNADALIYFPSQYKVCSRGRLIDFGIALGTGKKIILCGTPEPTIYQRGGLIIVCEPDTLVETVKQVLKI